MTLAVLPLAHLALEDWDSAPCVVSSHPTVLGSSGGPCGDCVRIN